MNQRALSFVDARRQICQRCWRPQRVCICQWIVNITPLVELVILQHPLEVKQAKGSARLLHLSLNGSQMQTGEFFDDVTLRGLLHVTGKTSVLLYPEFFDTQEDLMRKPPKLVPEMLLPLSDVRLIVLDGTWRKSRKMLYLNPLLQALPRLSLSNMPATHYRIRKAHCTDQLSTLEASCYALTQLEQNSEKYIPLLSAFDGFIGQQMELMHRGEEPKTAD